MYFAPNVPRRKPQRLWLKNENNFNENTIMQSCERNFFHWRMCLNLVRYLKAVR